MPRIPWKESYSVGVRELDEQHQRLLEIINDLGSTREEKRDSHRFFAVLNALIKYAESHFETEERYMREHGYADFEDHREQHVLFTERIFLLQAKLEREEPRVRDEVLDFLREWHLSHVLGVDRHYIRFFAQKQVK